MKSTGLMAVFEDTRRSLAVLMLLLALLVVPMAIAADDSAELPPPPVPQVNINTADAETLALALEGVGPARAMDIVAWRETNGPFTSIEQLQDVRGIGPVTMERNRDRIVIE